MPQTFFHNLDRSHGKPITVEYQWDDETCICIVGMWPNTQEYSDLRSERTELEVSTGNGGRANRVTMDPDVREKLVELDRLIEELDEKTRLTDDEVERIEHWLSENHTQISDAGGGGDEIRFRDYR